jgi:hypothetical protein
VREGELASGFEGTVVESNWHVEGYFVTVLYAIASLSRVAIRSSWIAWADIPSLSGGDRVQLIFDP